MGVLARGMRDNPLHMAAYGEDPQRRLRCHTRLMRGLFAVFSAQEPICAVRGDTIVGVTGVAPVGTCSPTNAQRLRFLPYVARSVRKRRAGWGRGNQPGPPATPTSPTCTLDPSPLTLLSSARGSAR